MESPKNRIKELTIVTRFFNNRPDSTPDKIIDFAKRYSQMAGKVIIAINGADDLSGSKSALEALGIDNLIIIDVCPWGKFVFPMNALVSASALQNPNSIMLSLSVEVMIELESITAILAHMDDSTLVTGALFPDHEFHPSEIVQGNGITTPWNTAAAWNLQKLSLVGFPLAGDALFDPTRKGAGVEEVTAIALMQKLFSGCDAKLVAVPGIAWQNDFSDNLKRLEAHRVKMASKIQRPAEQLARLGIPAPIIQHIAGN